MVAEYIGEVIRSCLADIRERKYEVGRPTLLLASQKIETHPVGFSLFVCVRTCHMHHQESGQGSCYLFRLDKYEIVDATHKGNMVRLIVDCSINRPSVRNTLTFHPTPYPHTQARFVNHSCDPTCYARVVAVDSGEKKIVFFAKRPIEAGEEVTYAYNFPLEDDKIPCYCGARNCMGSMN